MRQRDLKSLGVSKYFRLAIGAVCESGFWADHLFERFGNSVLAVGKADLQSCTGNELRQLSFEIRDEHRQRPGTRDFDNRDGAQMQAFPEFEGVAVCVPNPEIVSEIVTITDTFDCVDGGALMCRASC